MELNRDKVKKQMQKWCDNVCENACLKGQRLNGKTFTCEICFPNTVKNALALINELTEANERLNTIWAKQCVELEERCMALGAEVEDLRAENERLHASCTELERKCASLTEENAMLLEDNRKTSVKLLETERKVALLTVENERLRGENVDATLGFRLLEDAFERLEKINEQIEAETRADTVREMQEKLKAKAYTNNYCQEVVLLSDIDQITKEMVEGNDGRN